MSRLRRPRVVSGVLAAGILAVVLATTSLLSQPRSEAGPTPSIIPSAGRTLGSRAPGPAPTASEAASVPIAPFPTVTATPSQVAPPTFEFVRFLVDGAPIVSEPGRGESIGRTAVELVAPVLGRTVVDGVEWIRVQFGHAYDLEPTEFGWVPSEATVEVRRRELYVDQVYAPTTLSCPSDTPTVRDFNASLPTQLLACYGSQTLTLGPVLVRDESGGDPWTREPASLDAYNGLVMYGSRDWELHGSVGVHADPTRAVVIPPGQWLEVQGQFDHPAVDVCAHVTEFPDRAYGVATPEEAVLVCRERFVITSARVLSAAELPEPEPLHPPTPRDPLTATTSRMSRAPIDGRYGPAGVWTGSEVLIWGGLDDHRRPPGDGAAYDPAVDVWHRIPPAPVDGRWEALATWTSTEMLVFGGYGRQPNADGAAYDPATGEWRLMAESPFPKEREPFRRWHRAAWNGKEWLVAETRSGDGIIYLAAYDPALDSWRSLPSWEDPDSLDAAPFWAGEEPLLIEVDTDEFRRLRPGEDEWVPFAAPPGGGMIAPVLWTGEHLVAVCWQAHVGRFDEWHFLAAWDPETDTWETPPPPPPTGIDVDGQIVIDERVIFPSVGVAYDRGTAMWRAFDYPRDVHWPEASVAVWAGDRQIVWGGIIGHSNEPPLGRGSVVIPDWWD